MMFSKGSSVSKLICANSLLLALFTSEIIGPNLVFSNTHFRCIRMYLQMVGALMLTEKYLDVNLCRSTEVISSSSCSFASTKTAISVVNFDFHCVADSGTPKQQFSCCHVQVILYMLRIYIIYLY